MFNQIRTALEAARARSRSRRDYMKLLDGDDAVLRDIGLRRADIRRALQSGSSHF